LARAIVRHGGEVTIFAAGFSHGTAREVRVRRGALVTSQVYDGVRFVWLRTFPYRGNDWRRMVNMASYAVMVVLAQFGRPRPDVVVGSTVHPFAALAGWLVARLRAARFIYEVRDLWPQTLIDLGAMRPSSPGARLLWAIETFLVRRAESVVSVLPGMIEYLDGRELPSRHVHYLPNGVDLAEWSVARDPGARADEGPVDELIESTTRKRVAGEVVFLYLGAHGRVNRLEIVLRAFGLATARTTVPLRLLMVGDGPEKRSLRELAATNGLSGIEFVDPIARIHVPRLLEAVDVGIVHTTYTPVYRYGVSFNKLFDYMAASLPIAFACSTAFDPIRASGAGRSVAPDDPVALAGAMVELAEIGKERRSALGRAGRRYLEREHDMRRIGETFAGLVGCRNTGQTG
jgi:glycosyltransferase involved in cell wall biosynthesis